jgi:RNA polymerase sigma-70 factor (ECF subfamily)
MNRPIENTTLNDAERDENLLLRSSHGDQQAMAELVKTYGGVAFASAFAILRNREDAEEVVQEAFVKAFKKIHQLRDGLSFPGWLRSIVRQECYGLIRLYKRKFLQVQAFTDELFLTKHMIVDSKLNNHILQQEVWDISMACLSERAREIVTLHYVEGMTCENIASLMSITEGSVKSHLFKARKKIATRLRQIGIKSMGDLSVV